MATNPKPPEPDNPSSVSTSSATSSSKSGNNNTNVDIGNIFPHATADGGNPVASSDSINHLAGSRADGGNAVVGDVLAGGLTTGSNSYSGGGSAAGGSASSDNSLSNVGNSDVEITHEAPDLSETVPNIALGALVAAGCIGSGNAALSIPGFGAAGGKTKEHKRCTRLLYAAAVDSYGTKAHRALSFEITCGDYVVLEADLLMNTHLCMKNEPNGSNVTIPAYVSRPVVLQELAANITGRK